MKIQRIFLDLDDVLNTFVPFALQQLGCKCRQKKYEDYPAEYGWDLVGAFNKLHPWKRYTRKEFWEDVDHYKVWSCCPKSDVFDLLIEESIKIVGQGNIFILTTPTFSPECLAGKLKWIQKKCPKWLQRQYIITPRKYVCAQPGSLLIDDYEDNCCKFGMNGGEYIVFPRPWNSQWAYDIKPYIERCFKTIKELNEISNN